MTMNKVKTLDDLKKMRKYLFVRLWICVRKSKYPRSARAN